MGWMNGMEWMDGLGFGFDLGGLDWIGLGWVDVVYSYWEALSIDSFSRLTVFPLSLDRYFFFPSLSLSLSLFFKKEEEEKEKQNQSESA